MKEEIFFKKLSLVKECSTTKKSGDSIIKNFDFLKRFGTRFDLYIDLLNEEIVTLEVEKEWEEFPYLSWKCRKRFVLQVWKNHYQNLNKVWKMKRQKKSDAENQEEKGLKIWTQDQMLSRLAIFFSSIKSSK